MTKIEVQGPLWIFSCIAEKSCLKLQRFSLWVGSNLHWMFVPKKLRVYFSQVYIVNSIKYIKLFVCTPSWKIYTFNCEQKTNKLYHSPFLIPYFLVSNFNRRFVIENNKTRICKWNEGVYKSLFMSMITKPHLEAAHVSIRMKSFRTKLP